MCQGREYANTIRYGSLNDVIWRASPCQPTETLTIPEAFVHTILYAPHGQSGRGSQRYARATKRLQSATTGIRTLYRVEQPCRVNPKTKRSLLDNNMCQGYISCHTSTVYLHRQPALLSSTISYLTL
eukprot:scaffold6441_cov115-Skeletonema_dohrnii-CCMP3373.AAC.7